MGGRCVLAVHSGSSNIKVPLFAPNHLPDEVALIRVIPTDEEMRISDAANTLLR